MHKTLKKVLGIAGIGGTVGLLAILGISAAVHASVTTMNGTWQQDVDRQRRAIQDGRFPVLEGPVVAGNGAPSCAALLPPRKQWPLTKDERSAVDQALEKGPGQPLTQAGRAVLDRYRPALMPLSDALRHDRYDWEFRYEDGYSAVFPPFAEAALLGNLLVLDGHDRVAAGDDAGALRRYLLAFRWGACIANSHLVISQAVGGKIQSTALTALGQWVLRRHGGPLPLRPDIERFLKDLPPMLVDPVTALDGERLFFNSFAHQLAQESVGSLALSPEKLGMATFFVFGAPVMDAVSRDFRLIATTTDRQEIQRLDDQARRRITRSWNPLISVAAPSMTKLILKLRKPAAWLGMVQTAVALEDEHARHGVYPPDLTHLSVPHADPLSGAPLKYALSGRSYRLWSVGENGVDDHGHADAVSVDRPVAGADDMVLE